jgi:hypothetical protein
MRRWVSKAARAFGLSDKKILLTAAALILAILVAEGAARLWMDGRSPIALDLSYSRLRHPKPYVMFGGAPNAPITEFPAELVDEPRVLNRYGYRGKEPFLPKPKEECRIFMTGGSTVFLGAPSLPELLEKEFRNAGFAGVRVYNYGVPSAKSGDELARIVYEIADFRPDLVLMYNGGNNLCDVNGDPRPAYPFNFILYEKNPLILEAADYPALTLAAFGSVLLRHGLRNFFEDRLLGLERFSHQVRWDTPEWREAASEAYVSHAVKAHLFTRALGADFLLLLQPMLFWKDAAHPAEADTYSYFLALKEGIIEGRDVFRSALRRAERERGLRWADLTDMFDRSQEPVFTDYIHLRQAAFPAVAGRIFDETVGIVKRRKNP